MRKYLLYRDLFIVGLSVVATIFLVQLGVFGEFVSVFEEKTYIGSVIAGFFFTSVFTVAPASVVLAELAQISNPTMVALWGAIGAMLGDLALFLFVRDVFGRDLRRFLKAHVHFDVKSFFHHGFMKWLAPIVGAIIIASPLPDELGLAIMGLSGMRMWIFLPLTFFFNFLGIFALAMIVTGGAVH